MENNTKKGSFLGIVPLLCFLVVYFVMGIATGDFANFPLMIGMFLAMAISLVIKKPGGDTLTFSQKVDLFTSAPQGITPYAGQLLAIGGLAAISPITVAPFVFYSWLMFIFGIVFILIGFPKMVYKPREEKAAVDAE